jgi:hypothetical protein
VQLLHDGKGYKLIADSQPAQVKQTGEHVTFSRDEG